MSTWHDVLDEYGEKRGMEVLGKMAQKWFRRPPLEPDAERDTERVVVQECIHTADRIRRDLEAGLEAFSLENLSFAVTTWYSLTKMLDLGVVGETDHPLVGMERDLLSLIQSSVKTHGIKAVYQSLIEFVEGQLFDVTEMLQVLRDLMGDNPAEWDWDQSYLAREILERVQANILYASAMERLGVGETVFEAMGLQVAAADILKLAVDNMSILAPRASRYIYSITSGLDVTTEPDKWLYVGADIFDLWFAASRERDKWIRTLAVAGFSDTELHEAAKVYVTTVCAED